jgi:hypothetical protein
MTVESPSFCDSKIVVPISATTKAIQFPRIWFVEINTDRGEEMNLIRPE